jgi:FeS assembly SUF system regulator
MAKSPTQVFSAKSLAELLKMGPATVSKIMKMLAAQGLVGATRGAEGGYRLLKAPEAVSVVDILVAMEGPVAITECTLSGHRCGQAHDCGVQGHWQRMNQVIMEALSQVSLADLTKPSAMNPFMIPVSSLVTARHNMPVVPA